VLYVILYVENLKKPIIKILYLVHLYMFGSEWLLLSCIVVCYNYIYNNII